MRKWFTYLLFFAVGICFFGNSVVADTLLVSSMSSNKIYSFTSDGSQSTFASGLNWSMGLAFDNNGNLFEADNQSGRIYKFTLDGTKSLFASALNLPRYLAFDKNGNLFASAGTGAYGTGTIYKFTPAGTRSTFVTGLTHSPYGLAFDADGNLFDADYDGGKIYKFTPSGNMTTFATGFRPLDLAFDRDGDLFACDLSSGSVYELSQDGIQSTFATGLVGPKGLAFDSGGNLFVSDDHKIYEFQAGKSKTTFIDYVDMPWDLAFVPVPEPSTIALLGMGGIGLIAWSWRRRKA